jgi:hypothetical protein
LVGIQAGTGLVTVTSTGGKIIRYGSFQSTKVENFGTLVLIYSTYGDWRIHSDTGLRAAARAYYNQTFVFTSGTWTYFHANKLDYDNYGGCVGAEPNCSYTTPVAGFYRVTVQLCVPAGANPNYIQAGFARWVSGAWSLQRVGSASASPNYLGTNSSLVTGTCYSNGGEAICMAIFTTPGQAVSVGNPPWFQNYIEWERIG